MAEPSSAPRENGPLLVLCGVAPALTVTLGGPDRVLAHRTAPAAGRAAEVLAPLIAAVLAEAGCTVTEVRGVACVRGPGSFTGIRVVLATAVGLSAGAGIPMAGLDYLPLLAATAARRATGAVVAITHARREQVYIQPFLADDGLAPLGPPEALFVAQAAARVGEAAAIGPLWLVGDAVERYRDRLTAGAPMAQVFGPADNVPAPDVLLAAAARAKYGHTPPAPLYLRPSDAEENLAAIAAGRGLSPEDAAARLHQAVTAP